jgi:hypothetical protein
MEMVSETLEFFHHLTRLPARENFIEFRRRENFKHILFHEYSKFKISLGRIRIFEAFFFLRSTLKLAVFVQ